MFSYLEPFAKQQKKNWNKNSIWVLFNSFYFKDAVFKKKMFIEICPVKLMTHLIYTV